MFRFLNEINDEIAREERLLKVAIERSKDSDDYRGSMILRGPKGKKVLVKQRRYVDDAGRRRSEEVVIGAVESGEAANYIGNEYNTKLAIILQNNIKHLKRLSARYKAFDFEDIIISLPELSQRIIRMSPTNAFLIDKGTPSARIASKGKDFANKTTIMSSDGLQVRSKSEAIICNLLSQYSIEYMYEERLELKDEKGFRIIRVPDFTIKTKKGIVIWEHLGLLDNDEYFETNASKLRLYWMTGFVLNENLIVTVDERGGGINARTIDNIIKTSIVPYI
ncbi:MAG: hypothetical protein J5928_00610 [Firmicutes bacterium]|nr:hypothetical protein [Bacillota bacterium]